MTGTEYFIGIVICLCIMLAIVFTAAFLVKKFELLDNPVCFLHGLYNGNRDNVDEAVKNLKLTNSIDEMRRQIGTPYNREFENSPEVRAKIAELEAELAYEEAKLAAENSSL